MGSGRRCDSILFYPQRRAENASEETSVSRLLAHCRRLRHRGNANVAWTLRFIFPDRFQKPVRFLEGCEYYDDLDDVHDDSVWDVLPDGRLHPVWIIIGIAAAMLWTSRANAPAALKVFLTFQAEARSLGRNFSGEKKEALPQCLRHSPRSCPQIASRSASFSFRPIFLPQRTQRYAEKTTSCKMTLRPSAPSAVKKYSDQVLRKPYFLPADLIRKEPFRQTARLIFAMIRSLRAWKTADCVRAICHGGDGVFENPLPLIFAPLWERFPIILLRCSWWLKRSLAMYTILNAQKIPVKTS